MQEKFQTMIDLSEQDFLAFGLNDVAYVRLLDTEAPEDNDAVGIFAADGTQMATVANRDVAFAAIRQHDMEPLSVH
jgi:hypothetical protein